MQMPLVEVGGTGNVLDQARHARVGIANDEDLTLVDIVNRDQIAHEIQRQSRQVYVEVLL